MRVASISPARTVPYIASPTCRSASFGATVSHQNRRSAPTAVDASVTATSIRVDRPAERHPRLAGYAVQHRLGADLVEVGLERLGCVEAAHDGFVAIARQPPLLLVLPASGCSSARTYVRIASRMLAPYRYHPGSEALIDTYVDLYDLDLAPRRTIDRHNHSTHRWRFDRMNTSKLLGATMVAGALATGGAFAGISSAGAASSSTGTGAATTQSATRRRHPRRPRPRPRARRPERRRLRERPGEHSCPGMGSGPSGSSGSGSGSGSSSGASVPGSPPGRAPSSKDIPPSGRLRPGPHRGEALARRGRPSTDDRSCWPIGDPHRSPIGRRSSPESVWLVAAVISHLGELARRGETGEVDGLVVACAAAQTLGICARRAFDEHLDRTADEPLGALAGAALNHLQQALHPLDLHRVRDEILGQLGRRGAAPRREDEREGAVVADLLRHFERLARSPPRSRPGSRR